MDCSTFSCDLHVLGTPPALILSQDQTLVCNLTHLDSTEVEEQDARLAALERPRGLILVRMTKPQLHRHLTTGIFNQLSKILKKLRLSDFFLDRAAGKFRQVLELCALFSGKSSLSAMFPVFCATKLEYQFSSPTVNPEEQLVNLRLHHAGASFLFSARPV